MNKSKFVFLNVVSYYSYEDMIKRFPKLKDPKHMKHFLNKDWVEEKDENFYIVNTSCSNLDEEKYHLLGEGWDSHLRNYDERVINSEIEDIDKSLIEKT
tara:strand:- start:1363 stop:1659 length:297 start_codon:yes stop_codon:yes gene_type:complete